MNYTIKSPETASHWEIKYNFRWDKLRKHLQHLFLFAHYDKEQDSCHLIAVDSDEKVVGTGRLHFNSEQEGQIRYMAVNESIQRKGLGSSIVLELEMMAKKKGAKKMVLNARENALNFYLSLGYKEIEPYESDTGIPHTTMRKELI